MAFQAFDNKRKSLLGSLTRRRRVIDDLVTAQVNVSQIELNYQRAEVDKIAKAHHEATNEMLITPENDGEVADRLQTNIDRFAESYDEIQAIFNRFEENLEPARIENPSSPQIENNVQRLHPSVIIEQNGNNDHLKKQVDMFADQLYDLMFPVKQEEAQGYPRDQLQALLNEINQAKTQLNDAFGKLILEVDSEEKDAIRERKREIQSNCLQTTALLYKLMEDKVNLRVTPSTTSSNVDFSTKLKLPPIEVPKFNGSPEEWIPFRDLYVTMIHENSQLSGSQKFRYLKTCVIDKLSPIKFLAETDVGYEDAWRNVIAFYDNKRKIIDSHFNSLLNAKKMTAENCDELQKLINDYSSNIEALQRLLSKEELFDALTAHLITQRLDVHTRDLLETENDEEVPLWSTVKKCLEKRRKTLSALLPSKIQSRPFQEPLKSKVHHATSSESFDAKCLLCCEKHRLMNCPQFKEMDVSQRFYIAKEKRLCFNCLSESHGSNKCTSSSRCRTCKQKHHTLLHFNKQGSANQSSNMQPEIEPFVPHVMNKRSHENYASSHTAVSMEAVREPVTSKNQTLLSTIAVYVYDDEGNMHLCRALLDSGSDSNFITMQCAKKLNLNLEDTCMSLTGINDKTSIIRFQTSTVISSHYGPFETSIKLSVMAKITGDLPTQPVDINLFKIPNGYVLADPKFHKAAPIDLLLNAEVFFESLLGEKFRLPEGPMLIHTKFGWIIGGEIKSSTEIQSVQSSSLLSCFSYSNSDDINQSLERFFESEDISSLKPTWTAEEKYCEEVFKLSTSRDETGRFVTFMPKKWVNKELGRNLSRATRQFYAQEARRQKDQVYNELYTEYMTDFIESGHMSEVKPQDCAYYLPHHGVVNMTSTSTKVRPVFDASSQSETGVALNDVLCVGPTIQPESIDIITRFREKKFVITGDISRMYRQIWIDPSQRKYLSLLWRPKSSEPIKHYQINVVAFGTSCASFIAIRVLQQIAEENVHRFPQASALICQQVYVDDLMFSVNSIEEGVKRRDEILLMLSEAGMQLCKMTANHPDLLHGLSSSAVGSTKNSSMIKALGILYDYQADEFSYQLKSPTENDNKLTKATVLAIIASIYDPIGWIGPVLVMAKLFMKKLWLNKLDWKDELPDNLKDEWIKFHENLPCVNAVKIHRQCLIDNVVAVELHGFCDASINAYGAVIYVRSYNQNGNIQISILCSKSRVAPKNQKTLARLELCAATLLSKLMSRYAAVLSVSINDVVLWSDSTIVLNWMTMVPSRL